MAKSQSKSKAKSRSSSKPKGKPRRKSRKAKPKTGGSRPKQSKGSKGRSRGRGRSARRGKKKTGSGKKKKKKSRKSKDKNKDSEERGPPDVSLMVRRKKTTIFLDVRDDMTVLQLKQMITGITKTMTEDQKLFRDRDELKNDKHLRDYGLNPGSAKPQSPALLGLVFKDNDGVWEELDITPYSQSAQFPPGMTLSDSSK